MSTRWAGTPGARSGFIGLKQPNDAIVPTAPTHQVRAMLWRLYQAERPRRMLGTLGSNQIQLTSPSRSTGMENLMRFLRAPDVTSGSPMPPRFRPGMHPSRHRRFYGAMRNARDEVKAERMC